MLRGSYRLVYAAPERLARPDFREALGRSGVWLLVVDEAHCVSEWGHDFRPEYLRIARAAGQIGRLQVLALTATATPETREDIARQLGITDAERVVAGFDRPNLRFRVRRAESDEDKLKALPQELQGEGSAIVYVGTRRAAEEVALFLVEVVGARAEAYHAGLSADQRRQVQDRFMSGDTRVVAATNAFGLGIDKPDIRSVIHFNIPGSLEAYYQEAGRAGRDGEPADCCLLYSTTDRLLQQHFIDADTPTAAQLRQLWGLLDEVPRPVAGPVRVIWDEILQQIAEREDRIEVALSELEKAGALVVCGREGRSLVFELLRADLPDQLVAHCERSIDQRRRRREQKLARMISYAEATRCRREQILTHFGDVWPGRRPACCDVCDAQVAPPQLLSRRERIILQCVKDAQRPPVGATTIAAILCGSRAKKLGAWRYDELPLHGRLTGYRQREVTESVQRLIDRELLVSSGGTYPTLRLSVAGERALAAAGAGAQKPSAPLEDAVEGFVMRRRSRRLDGAFDEGYALDLTAALGGGPEAKTEVGRLITALKYGGDEQAGRRLAELLAESLREWRWLGSVQLVVPIPGSAHSPAQHPVARVAAALSAATGLPVCIGALAMTRQTRPQKDMGNEVQKRENVRGAFKVTNRELVAGKCVLLLDDLYDSGATMDEVTRVLRAAGAETILAAALGKTIHAN
jgi:ATP-dependent DNA helicase RecQ